MVRIIHFLNKYLKYIKVELYTEHVPMSALYDPNSPYYRSTSMKPSNASDPNYSGTCINPSTGLPISGSVDASGSTYGAYHDDYYRRSSSDDYHRHQTHNYPSPSYDPFNRY